MFPWVEKYKVMIMQAQLFNAIIFQGLVNTWAIFKFWLIAFGSDMLFTFW
jgi:hypothetical protein